MLFAEAPHAFVIDLQAVPGLERRGRLTSHCLRIISHFLEHLLEPSRGNDLKDPQQLVAGVPKSMLLLAGFENEIPFLCVHNLIAELRPHASLEDVAVLVLVCVPVKRSDERSRGDWMLICPVYRAPNQDGQTTTSLPYGQ